MKISYLWLKEFVDFDQTPDELAQMLTFLGVETSVLAGGKPSWTKVVTAKVIAREKHPQADKLSLCQVTDGTVTYPVVCGASNVAAGQIVALALIGAVLPGDFKIKKAKIRGVESEGMLCSEKELGLAAESSGIMVLPENTPLGKPLQEVLGDTDTILEVEITTNRPDCLSHWGVAREIGAKLRKPVRLPEIPHPQVAGSVPISIADPELCSRYIGCAVNNVTVGPSPDWMARRLEKCGLRPINNIVDITNYVLLELGHPLHAFDTETLAGGEIVVRRANPGEKIRALDGKEYSLTGEMLAIADKDKPQAIAGTIGGEYSGVTEKTKNIILESALFKPQSVRRTSKALGIMTDASYRFERGTGWTVCETASWRALDLILRTAGGTLTGRNDRQEKPYVPVTITLRPSRVNRVLGLEVPAGEIKESLTSLGITVSEKDGLLETEIPSWRLDLHQEIDLVEETARMIGYDRVPVTIPAIHPPLEQGKSYRPVESILRERFSALGMCEAVNYSLLEEKELTYFRLPVPHRIANPLSRENEVLRSSLLPGLWNNFILNLDQGYGNVKLFESGTIFLPEKEKSAVGFIVHGRVWPEWWKWEGKDIPAAVDFDFLSGMVCFALASDGTNRKMFKLAENTEPSPYFHPGKTAAIVLKGKKVGEFGMISPEYTGEIGEVGYGEIDLRLLEAAWNRETYAYEPLRRHPPVKRDISVVAKRDVPFEKIAEILRSSIGGNSLLADFTLFSVYDKLGPETISYSLHLIFRSAEHTLTDAEVNGQVEKLLKRLGHELGVTLR